MSDSEFRILVVEDDDDHADLLSYGLERVGGPESATLELERSRDGEEALVRLRDTQRPRPDLVLLDLNMPRMGGLEVLEALSGDAELSIVPVVVLSTSDADSDRNGAYRNGANGYLVKPADFGLYGEMLDSVVEYWARWNRGPLDDGAPQE